MNEIIIILSETEKNDHYNPQLAGNGGGYHQPEYHFQYGSWEGRFLNTSCGYFGSRYHVEVSDGKHEFSADWGSMYDYSSSNFPETFPTPEFYKDFEKRFRTKIPTDLQARREYGRKWGWDYDEYAEFHDRVGAWERERKAREGALLKEYGVAQ